MAPNDALRAGALLLNAIADLAVDVEGQLRDGGQVPRDNHREKAATNKMRMSLVACRREG
jgi:hypothetical protein